MLRFLVPPDAGWEVDIGRCYPPAGALTLSTGKALAIFYCTAAGNHGRTPAPAPDPC